MLFLYFKLIVLIPLLLFLLLLFILSIKYKIDSKFKKNCFKCKHYKLDSVAPFGGNCKYYKLHSVSSFGGKCKYKCTLKNILYS